MPAPNRAEILRRAREAFFEHVLQGRVIQGQLGHDVLQSPVLVLERSQLLGVADLHPAELRLPPVKGLLADAVPPAELLCRRPGLRLLQNPDDLLLRKPLPFMSSPFVSLWRTHTPRGPVFRGKVEEAIASFAFNVGTAADCASR